MAPTLSCEGLKSIAIVNFGDYRVALAGENLNE